MSSKKITIPHITPLTKAQRHLLDGINRFPISIGLGPAGTGKTFVTAFSAAKCLIDREVDRIILTRANIPTGRTLGHFPGTINDKLSPWLAPILNNLKEFLGTSFYEYCLNKNKIQLQPLETIRGNSYDCSFIILDEAQNLTVSEMTAVVTRIGNYSTLVILGDPFQTDIKELNGLKWLENLIKKYKLNIGYTEFKLEDVVRSDIVKDILKAIYEEKGLKI